MIRHKDIPYIRAIKELSKTEFTSEQMDRVVAKTNLQTGIYYTSEQVINILNFCNIVSTESHLGQPRHGRLIQGARLFKMNVLWNDV